MKTIEATAYKIWRFTLVPFNNNHNGSPEFIFFDLMLKQMSGSLLFSLALMGFGFVIGFNMNRL